MDSINVTEHDIEHGLRASELLCPIAHSINREHPIDGEWHVLPEGKIVAYQVVEEDSDEAQIVKAYDVGDLGRYFIKNFDEGIPVEPIRLKLYPVAV